MGKVNLFKEFKNTLNNNSPSFKTVNELNDIILEIKLNPSELSEKQEIKLNKLEPKLERFENKVIINKLNDTSLIHKNEILNTVADLDTSVIKPFINTINKINETDLPEILDAIQAIPKTDLQPVLDAIKAIPKTDVDGILAAIANVPTVDDITSAVDELTDRIIGNDYFALPGRKLLPELITDVQSDTNAGFETTNNKLDEITGAINNINCAEAPVASALEEAVVEYETKAAEYYATWGNIDDSEYVHLELLGEDVFEQLNNVGTIAPETEEYVLRFRYYAMVAHVGDNYCEYACEGK